MQAKSNAVLKLYARASYPARPQSRLLEPVVVSNVLANLSLFGLLLGLVLLSAMSFLGLKFFLVRPNAR